MFETRKEGELILIFAKKKMSKNVKIGSVLCPPKTTKKEYFREHFRASEFNLNARSSRSVIITIKRRVVSRGARD
mgnify:CR=1 FL=1